MGHFAEIDKDNKVLIVYTACNEDIKNHGGEQSEEAATYFASYTPLSKDGVKYIQTSYNNNFRKQYAGVGYTYDPVNNVFIRPKPFESWILDENFDWQPPTGYPNINTVYDSNYFKLKLIWNEEDKKFTVYDIKNNIFPYDNWNLNNVNKYEGPILINNYPINSIENEYKIYWDSNINTFKAIGYYNRILKYNSNTNEWENEFLSWVKNQEGIWNAPVEWPSIETYGDGSNWYKISWDEVNLCWKGLDNKNNTFYWNPTVNSWISNI